MNQTKLITSSCLVPAVHLRYQLSVDIMFSLLLCYYKTIANLRQTVSITPVP